MPLDASRIDDLPAPHTLQAGRALDALVAERVMGCGDLWHHYYDQHGMQRRDLPAHVPQFSTDLAAAWTVVEQMKAGRLSQRRRFIEALREEMPKGAEDQWTVSPSWWVFYLTPEAICLAALKAVSA